MEMTTNQTEDLKSLLTALTNVCIYSERIAKAETEAEGDKETIDNFNTVNGSANKHIGVVHTLIAKTELEDSESTESTE